MAKLITLSNLRTFKEELVADYTEVVNEVDGKVTAVEGRVGTAEGKITTAEGKITAAEGKIATAESNITALQGGVQAVEGNVTTLQGQMSTAEGKISAAEGKITTAEGKITTLEGDVDAAEGNIEELQGKMTTAEGKISAAEGKITTAEGNITSLQGSVSAAEGNIGTLQGNVQEINTALAKKVEAVEGKGLSTNDFTDAYKNKVDTLEANGGQPNVIETVKVNGAAVAVDGKAVNIDLTSYATKADITSVYKYKGSVASYSALPTEGNVVGDVYDVQAADVANGVEAGANVAWNGTSWDSLGGKFDASALATKAELDSYVLSSELEEASDEEVKALFA